MRRLSSKRMKRIIAWSLVLGFAGLLAIGIAGTWVFRQAVVSNVGTVEFTNRLAVPPLLEPVIDEQGRAVFDLEFVAGQTELIPGKYTDTWGLNGSHLAPTLRAARGEEVVINVTNGIDEPTTLHWHGMHLPAAMDGGPHQLIAPGEVWSPTWTIDQPAATLWFHPHLHGNTAEHVYRGAAGLFLVEDQETERLSLPSTYGIDDVPLILQDKRFDDDGSLSMRTSLFSSVGVLGDTMLVNGTHRPVFEATTTLVRFRLLNASNARVYNLGFTDDRTYTLIGTDSGLLEEPVPLTRLPLSPGERAEIVVEVAPGEETMLRSFPPNLGLDFFPSRMNGGDDTFDLLRIEGSGQLVESPSLPLELVSIDRPDEESAVRTRAFDLNGASRINGREMDMTRVDAVVTVDTVEIWEIRNASGTFHNFHIHDIHFAVLDINGDEPPPHLRGWKDTIFLAQGDHVRVIARFDDYADPETPFMFHCHLLLHEDQGMMGQFVVVEPGMEPPARLEAPHADHRGDSRSVAHR
jgi:FtsP/CotA-like multicopper oxidase with cupredoxin domain